MDWKLDGKELASRKTIEEKEKIQQKEMREAALKVAAYIALAFKNLQNSLLYGYHTTSSKFNSILKALFDIFYSM